MKMDISKCTYVIIRDENGKLIDKFEIDSISILDFKDKVKAVEFKKSKSK